MRVGIDFLISVFILCGTWLVLSVLRLDKSFGVSIYFELFVAVIVLSLISFFVSLVFQFETEDIYRRKALLKLVAVNAIMQLAVCLLILNW